VEKNNSRTTQRSSIKWQLVFYDAILLALVSLVLIGIYPSEMLKLPDFDAIIQILLSLICVLGTRALFGSYRQVWRYARTINYIQLMLCDLIGGVIFFILQKVLPVQDITFVRALCNISSNLLLTIAIRLLYQYIYEYFMGSGSASIFLRKALSVITGLNIDNEIASDIAQTHQINVAIVGAGRVGAMLAEELLSNPNAAYVPKCFIDVDQGKVGRYINGIQVISESEATLERLSYFPIHEIVFAIPDAGADKKKRLYENYKATGCKLKVYDYPITQTLTDSNSKGKRHLREFDIEELLFRDVKDFTNDDTRAYYKNKVVLISGGGGSIGSELSRQIAKMGPKHLILLDVYENCIYDIQQELKIAYGSKLNLQVEIISVCDRTQLNAVFAKYHPDIVLHAAAHKHVPLMESNPSEAVINNVFGTLNTAICAKKYKVNKFILISTDKAVNPTNVMGATKRLCEMIIQSMDKKSNTQFVAVRFGNVLGSNSSVVPLFKKQIA
jgi:FlaA1/EpsC-like NDP-sugar epimerase